MKFSFLIGGILATLTGAAQLKSPAAFRTGDRVVFAGNSITEAGFYEMYIWQYYQLHFPNERINVFNGGIGGDVAGQINDRFEQDILRLKPSVVVLTFGMNDSRYFEYFNAPQEKVRTEAVATSFRSYQQIEAKLKALPKLRKILMTSSPFDETRGGSNNKFTGKYKTMLEIAAFQEEAAKKNNWAFVDLMRPMQEINEREQKRDSMFTLTGSDRIHPGNAGHMVMAWLFLRSQGLAGNMVADVVLNGSNGKLVRSVNSTITGIKHSNNELSFDYLAKSLPYPIDSNSHIWENPQKQFEALNVIPFTKEMNQEMLTVAGFEKTTTYGLSIDGRSIGAWTGEDLDKGINLAVISSTPQYQQATQIAELNLQYRSIEQKLRAYYWLQFNYFKKKKMLYQDDQAAMDSAWVANDWAVASKKENYVEARKKEIRSQWEKLLTEITDRIYTINKPKVHHIVITAKK